MGNRLRAALSANRDEIRAGIEEAEQELAQLEVRRNELIELIASGKRLLGQPPTGDVPIRPTTLHMEMLAILREHGNPGMRAPDIARDVNRRGNYVKRDGTDVQLNQMHARVGNYPDLFEKRNSLIYIKTDRV